ncbi:hypothetical protein OG936_18835 [Streptomyces sp. NBC_00846]|nr:hypothetical protein OG936_18835 [Streptomyces sp. NBC_00846]
MSAWGPVLIAIALGALAAGLVLAPTPGPALTERNDTCPAPPPPSNENT